MHTCLWVIGYDSLLGAALVAATAAFQTWLTCCRHWELAHSGLAPVCIDKILFGTQPGPVSVWSR